MIKDSFYEKGSDKDYLIENYDDWSIKSQLPIIQQEKMQILNTEQANGLNVEDFFYKLENDIKPRLNENYNYFALPYEVDDEFTISNDILEEHIVSLINNKLTNIKYMASTDSDKCCVIKFPKFSSELFWHVAYIGPHLNTPFIVFDEKKDFFSLLDYDLPIQIFGYKQGVLDEEIVEQYRKIFLDEWSNVLKRYESYTCLIPIAQEYYSFLFPNHTVPSGDYTKDEIKQIYNHCNFFPKNRK